jgi:folate-binding protein YgfZ
MTNEGTSALLAAGEAFVDLSFWRKIAVSGGGALEWLGNIISADISDLGPNRATRSLLLSPTGRVRADFTVAVPGGSLVLVQDPSQPQSIETLLAPYVLSSDVDLSDRTGDHALFAFPGRTDAPETIRTSTSAPSCLGAGVDLFAPGEDHGRLLAGLSESFVLAGDEDVEEWRVRAGIPRFGVDALEEDLPQEAGLEGAVSFDKGCYLGQEALAKVRNLGHPRRLLVHLYVAGPVSPGDPVLVGQDEVGEVTSVAGQGDERLALARVRWGAREGPFRTRGGVELGPRVPH